MGQIDQTIVVVLVVIHVRRDIDVINPHIGGKLDTDGITVVREDFGNGNVANDDVGGTLDKAFGEKLVTAYYLYEI